MIDRYKLLKYNKGAKEMNKDNSIQTRGYKLYKDLTFTDDFMFRKVLMSDKDLCRRLVELLLDVEIEDIQYKDDNHEIAINSDSKGVRLDVYLRDEKGTVFDLEMQNMKEYDMPRRSRYYQSLIDLEHLEKGATYDELPDSYIVFICTFDPFGERRHKYEFRELCNQNAELTLDSGTAKVFINAKGKRDIVSKEMTAFLDYLSGMGAKSELTKDIEIGISTAKGRKPWEVEYMTLYDEIRMQRKQAHREGLKQGIEQGEFKARIEAIEALAAEGTFTAEKACKILGVSHEDYLAHISEKDSQSTVSDSQELDNYES